MTEPDGRSDPAAARVDAGARLIKASPQAIYRAYLDPAAVARWRPPAGMSAVVHAFDARAGGGYRMSFVHDGADAAGRGKTTDRADVFEGRFVDLVPDRRIVERVVFESADPAFAGAMTVTTTLTPAAGGTLVAIACTGVPLGIAPADHRAGIASSLANLAAFAE
ncbi:MAG: SRPBCC domain-containing protein [Rhodospirillales bacterium]